MASIEFIQKRIEGKEKEIEKLQKKIARINAAKATNWEKNPYYYSERDLSSAEKELAAAQVALTNYQNQLNCEIEKSNSRNIPAILDFLDQWKSRVMEYYKQSFQTYLIALAEWRAHDHAYTEWSNEFGYRLRRENREEYNKMYNEHKEIRDRFNKKWNFLSGYVGYNRNKESINYFLEEDKLKKMLDQDANAKYDFIVERTNAIVGQIIDASNLTIGNKGDLNGIIIGTKGKAEVQTIGAGGYNEDIILDSGRHGQCYHFRTLINAVK